MAGEGAVTCLPLTSAKSGKKGRTGRKTSCSVGVAYCVSRAGTSRRTAGAGGRGWRGGVGPPALEAADDDGRRDADEHAVERELRVKQADHGRRHVSEVGGDLGDEQQGSEGPGELVADDRLLHEQRHARTRAAVLLVRLILQLLDDPVARLGKRRLDLPPREVEIVVSREDGPGSDCVRGRCA
eukprot:scaffold22805_cov59-Phaeocystis_antarctica.AAC.12